MAEIKALTQIPITKLIKWIEQNHDQIDEIVATFRLKDGSILTHYDVYSYFNALGLTEMAKDTFQNLSRDGNFYNKPKDK